MRFVVVGHRDYRVRYEVTVEAECEDDVTDERVGVAMAEATGARPGGPLEDWEGSEIVDEQIEDVTRVGDE